MLLHLIKKEILDHLLSLRFAILCIVCLLVILSSVLVLTKDYKDELVDYRTNLVMHRNEILGYDNEWELRDFGMKLDKPLNVMRIFFRGVDRQNTTTVQVRPGPGAQFEAGYAGNPVIPLFPPIDLTFFIGTIMSLLAIAFSYNAVSGEKELGTLRLLLSYSVPRDLLLLAKWIGGYLALVVPFLLAVISGLIIVAVFPDVHLASSEWAELGAILVVSLLYISAVYSLGILVSARTAMASTSVTVLLLVWVLLVLVIPNVMPYVSSQLSPAPSIQSVEKEKQLVAKHQNERFDKEIQEWIKENPSRRGDGPGCAMGMACHGILQDCSLRRAEGEDKINRNFQRTMAQQIELTKLLSRVSPLSSMVYAVGSLSGTGVTERNRFLAAVARYEEGLIRYTHTKAYAVDSGQVEEFDTSDYPKFVYEHSGPAERVRPILPDFLILVVWNLVFFMAAYLSFLRYDVR